ncbi:hypothetical protein Scep_023455 [Stephania cephalantha]|uniref:Uncharacterized protein n=1 Tax=Stephania cephalantha TaxID=152367 RepID=A0AAP0EXG3_9MAGN
MSLTFQSTSPTLLASHDLNESTITVFSLTDDAFLASHFIQVPMSLLEYHACGAEES